MIKLPTPSEPCGLAIQNGSLQSLVGETAIWFMAKSTVGSPPISSPSFAASLFLQPGAKKQNQPKNHHVQQKNELQNEL